MCTSSPMRRSEQIDPMKRAFMKRKCGAKYRDTIKPAPRGAGRRQVKLRVIYWPFWQVVVKLYPWKVHQSLTEVDGVCPKYFRKTKS